MLILKVMIHIKALSTTVALFCLSTVLCQGCALISNKKSIPTVPKVGGVSSQMDQKSNAEQSAQGAGQNLEKSDEKALSDELKPLLQQFMPTHASSQPTLSTAPQDPKGVALQKDMQEYQKQNMAQLKEKLNQSGLSGGQIEALMKLYEDASCKIMEQFFTLPDEKLKSLLNALKKQKEQLKDLGETCKQLEGILPEPVQSLEEGSQVGLEGNVHLPMFKELVKAAQEIFEMRKEYIHPENNWQLRVVHQSCAYMMYGFKKMEASFLACSPEEQQACQSHLKHFLSVLQSSLQEAKAVTQILPHALVEEIRSTGLEVAKQEAAIPRGRSNNSAAKAIVGKQEAINCSFSKKLCCAIHMLNGVGLRN